ncbi:MAG TPA: flagellar hook-associated protein FlgK [Candidatus Acidoferrales bacterium]
MSLGSSLFISVQAMLTDQAALAVTSNNIANVNTPGYTREVANMEEAAPAQFGNLEFGGGVQLSNIQSVRDNILQLRLNQETQSQGALNTFTNGMNQIQTVFNEASGAGLQSLLSSFFNSFQNVAADPTNSGDRQAVIGAAQGLASGFQQTATTLAQQQQNADQGVVQTVQQINQLTAQIANLNGEIATTAGANLNTNSFEDQRDQLITQLSGLIDLQTIAANGNTLTLTTNNGTQLVVGNQSFNLQTGVNPTTSFQDVYAQGTDITSSIQGGTLAGDIQLRDQEIPSLQNSLDTLAYNIENSVNSQNAAGYDLNGNAGGNIFQPPSVAGAALNMAVAITDPNLIAASGDGTSGDNTNATALANLQNQNIVNGQNPINYYADLVSTIGNDAQTASNQLTGGTLLIQQLNDQISSVSGVSLNEEGANLILYQNAYTAASRVANVVDTLYQTAIAMVPAAT